MENNARDKKTDETQGLLSTLWIFVTINYLYCDLITLMDAEKLKQFLTGIVGGMQFTQGFLLGAAVLMEIPIGMIFLSRVLKYQANRWANLSAGTVMTMVQTASLFTGTPSPFYLFFSIIEIACTLFIVWRAWKWSEQA
ncbi:MAG: hypothetical protein HGA76_02975 [Candidatus Firestonebacteria bacterium]|nr:hypothetical protein [Candidatus Firestonebacteria bacterium]